MGLLVDIVVQIHNLRICVGIVVQIHKNDYNLYWYSSSNIQIELYVGTLVQI